MRSHGRIYTSIWEDDDFTDMTVDAQRLYMFIISQPDLSHAGLIPLRLKRWSHTFPGGTVGKVSKALTELSKAGFVLFDRDTEEVLVRTFVRNDGVYKQPKVMLRMREDARLMKSRTLQQAFVAELERIPFDDLSDKPSGRDASGDSVRDVAIAVCESLAEGFAKGMRYPSERVSGRVSDTPAEGYPIPPRVRAGALHHPPSTIHSNGSESGGGYVSSDASLEAPPIQPCGEAHTSARACGACASAREAEKERKAKEAASAKAAQRQADADTKRAERERIERERAEAEADPDAGRRAIEQFKQARKDVA